MAIPHFKNIQTSNRLFEGVYNNLFEITWILPTILQAQNRDVILMLENATSIDMSGITPDIEYKTQKFKYSERFQIDTPSKTVIDLSVKFNVNQGDAGDIFIYNTLKAWYSIVWDSQSGNAQYKKNMLGTLIVNWHDKQGYVHTRNTFHNCAILGISYYGVLDFSETSILENISAKFVSDYWTEEKIDTASQIQLPNIYQ